MESVYSDSLEYKVLKSMVEVNEGNQWSDPNLASTSKFTLAQIYNACQSCNIDFDEDDSNMKDIQDADKLKQARERKLQKALENLVNDPV